MRLLIQRVQKAQVFIQNQLFSEIGSGLLVFLGIHREDDVNQVKWLVNKLIHLRIFEDEKGKMNQSIKDKKGEVLIVSQFTLYGNCLNGRRPDFIQAAPAAIAQPLYEQFIKQLSQEVNKVQTGIFGAEMQVALINDGPATFFLEFKKEKS